MKIRLANISCNQKREIKREVEQMGFNWEVSGEENIFITGVCFGMESFTAYLDNLGISWHKQ